MRAIAKGQLDGFPPAEELRTVYVESNIDASLSDLDVVSYVFQDPVLKGLLVSMSDGPTGLLCTCNMLS